MILNADLVRFSDKVLFHSFRSVTEEYHAYDLGYWAAGSDIEPGTSLMQSTSCNRPVSKSRVIFVLNISEMLYVNRIVLPGF
jgi:hypothetical protein